MDGRATLKHAKRAKYIVSWGGYYSFARGSFTKVRVTRGRKGKNSDKSGRSKTKMITRGRTKEDEFSLITILVHDEDTFQPDSPNGEVSNWQCARRCVDDFRGGEH